MTDWAAYEDIQSVIFDRLLAPRYKLLVADPDLGGHYARNGQPALEGRAN